MLQEARALLHPDVSAAVIRRNTTLQKLEFMREANIWFRPKTLAQAHEELPLLQAAIDVFKEEIETYRQPGRDFMGSWNTAMSFMQDSTVEGGREEEWRVVWKQAQRVATDGAFAGIREAAQHKPLRAEIWTARFSGWHSARAAVWEEIQDLPQFAGRRNFSQLLLDGVYMQGNGRVETKGVNGRERLLAHIPLVLPSGDRVLACWVDGEKELSYMHAWRVNCDSEQTPLPDTNPSPRLVTDLKQDAKTKAA